MTMRRLTVLGFVVTLAALVSPAAADANRDLERAKELLADLYFEEAEKAFTRALERGGNGPAEVAEIYLGLGEISASSGDTEAAVEHFRRALAINPGLELAEGTSPKVEQPFEKARESLGDGEGLRGVLVVDENDVVRVGLRIDADPLQMIALADVTYELPDGKSSEAQVKIRGEVTAIPLPADATGVEVTLLDRHGNQLAELGRTEVPTGRPRALVPSGPGPAPAPDRGEASGSVLTSPLLWGGLAVAFAGAGAGFGLYSRAAQSDLEELKERSSEVEFSEAQALEDQARQRALIANIAFGAAGAAAIATVVFLLTGDDEPDEAGARLSPALGPDRVGIAATISF
jgi:tetratricopeptide (TPR) repeat protein